MIKRIALDDETLVEEINGVTVVNEGVQVNGYFVYNPDATYFYGASELTDDPDALGADQ